MKTQNSVAQAHDPKPSINKRLGLGAFSISLLVHGLFVLVAVVFLYKWIDPPPEPQQEAVMMPGSDPGGDTVSKVKVQQHQRNIAVAHLSRPKILTVGSSDVFLPEGNPEMLDSALPSGPAMGAPPGPPVGVGNPGTNTPGGPIGGSKIFVTPLGGTQLTEGAIAGRFYDFKQTQSGKPTKDYQISRYSDFTSRVTDLQDAGFRETGFKKFFQAPDTLYLSQLAIPLTDASAGPKFFNVANKVKPSGWFVHYKGKASINRDITFRFVGTGDDYLSVYVKDRPRLIAAWPSHRTQVSGKWEPSEPIDDSAATPLPGGPLVKGDWIKLKRGESLDLDIGIGECPGGKVGFVLMIEEKGVEYPIASNGAPILPLFTSGPRSHHGGFQKLGVQLG
jgi:hypothetical protein